MKKLILDDSRGRATANAYSDRKAYETLAARYALAGCELHCEMPVDGVRRLHAIHRGKVIELLDLAAAREYLTQIGGAT